MLQYSYITIAKGSKHLKCYRWTVDVGTSVYSKTKIWIKSLFGVVFLFHVFLWSFMNFHTPVLWRNQLVRCSEHHKVIKISCEWFSITYISNFLINHFIAFIIKVLRNTYRKSFWPIPVSLSNLAVFWKTIFRNLLKALTGNICKHWHCTCRSPLHLCTCQRPHTCDHDVCVTALESLCCKML